METWSSLGQLSYQVSNLDDRVGKGGEGGLGIYAWMFRKRSYVVGMTTIIKADARLIWQPGQIDDEETREVLRGSMENGLPAERFLYPKLTNDGDLTKHSHCRYAVLELYSAGLPRPSLALHFRCPDSES